MSTIQSQSGPADYMRRQINPQVELPGTQGQLQTPGLVVAQPVSAGAQVADALLQEFSAIGGLSRVVVAQRRQDAEDARVRAALEKQHQRELDAADRGNANQFIAANAPSIVSAINRGDVRPNDGESIPDFVERVSLEGHDGQSEAFKDQLRVHLGQQVSEALQQRLDLNVKQARADNAALAVQSIDGATDGESFTKAVDAVRKLNPDITQRVAEAEVAQRWLNYAVSQARVDPSKATKVLTAARSTLGDRFKTEQLIAQNQYDAAVQADRNDKLREISDNVGQMLDHGAPYPTVLQFIEDQGKQLGVNVHDISKQVQTEHVVMHDRRRSELARERQDQTLADQTNLENVQNKVSQNLLEGNYAGAESAARESTIAERHILALVDQVRSHQNQQIAQSHAELKAQRNAEFRQNVFASGMALAEAGQANLIQSVKNPDGEDLTANEIKDAVMTSRFSDIAKQYKDNPNAAQDAIIQEAARNAYYPPAWKSMLTGAGSKITSAAFATSKDGTIPKETMGGYEFWKKLGAKAPGLLDSMNIDSRTTELFTLARELESVPMVGADPNTALKNAAEIVDNPRSQLDTVKFSALAAALDVQSQADREIAREAAPIARILTRAGKTPEDAVATAIKQVSVNRLTINGWSSRIDGVPESLKYQLADIAEQKIDAYAKSMQDAGISKSNLSFRFNTSNSTWEIIDRTSGLTVPQESTPTIFTAQNLLEEARSKVKSDAEAAYNKRLRDRQSQPLPYLIH